MQYIVNEKTVGKVVSFRDTNSKIVFLSRFVAELYHALSDITGDTFYLCLSEKKNGAVEDKPTHIVAVANEDGIQDASSKLFSDPSKNLQAFETVAKQYYYSTNSSSNSSASRCGCIEVQVIMFGGWDDENGSLSPNKLAESLIGLAFFYYSRLVQRYFSEWRTLYVDSPKIESHLI